jgi:5'-nucleotidase
VGSERDVFMLIDMDGVLAEFEGYFLEQFRKKWPEEPFIPIKDRRTFLLYDDEKYSHEQVNEILDAKGFFLNIPPIEGAVEALKEMNEMQGVNVFICTTPWLRTYPWSTVEKYQWVEKYMGKEWLRRIILTVDKTVIKGDLLIDDNHSIKGAEKQPTWEHVIFTAGHNRHVEGPRRLEGWKPRKTWVDIINDLKTRCGH